MTGPKNFVSNRAQKCFFSRPMLDIRAIRENPDAIKERLATKSAERRP